MNKTLLALARTVRPCARLLALALVALPTSTFALGKPITAYKGSAGDVPIELLLIHDWQLDGMDGFFISSLQNRALPLEKVPYQSGDGLLGVILEPMDLPRSALQLMPFELGQHCLHGRLVDLRTRSEQPVELKRTAHFGTEQDDAFDGDLPQLKVDARFSFRVHALKHRGKYDGHVDRIDVLDRHSGELLQQLRNLRLAFFGMETLDLKDFDGDGVLDFIVTPLVTRQSDRATVPGERQYFIYRPALGYQRHPQLEQLATRGHVEFLSERQLRVRTDVDFDRNVLIWEVYVFDASEGLTWVKKMETPR